MMTVNSRLIALISVVLVRSQANLRSHVVVSAKGSKAIRSVLKKWSRRCLIRTEIRNLCETDLPYLFSQPGGFEKVSLCFTASLRSRHRHGKELLCLLVN
jgi:hypothetical protein